MTGLKSLSVSETKVTEAGLAKLREKCRELQGGR